MSSTPDTLGNTRVSFDDQAEAYETRAGLPDAVCRDIAAQLVAGLGASATIVDVGAGTGTIGRHLVAAGVRYVGIDLSRPMLAELARAVTETSARALLLRADADATWPLADGVADAILFSRSAHLLKRDATLAEVERVAAPGCRVWVGRVRRERQSAPELLKRTMQHMLRDRELPGRNGERARRDFLEALERAGGRPLPAHASQEWHEDEAPMDSLTSWRGKEGLGGRVLSAAVKREILDELEKWAARELGDLDRPRRVPRRYELEGVQLA